MGYVHEATPPLPVCIISFRAGYGLYRSMYDIEYPSCTILMLLYFLLVGDMALRSEMVIVRDQAY